MNKMKLISGASAIIGKANTSRMYSGLKYISSLRKYYSQSTPQ